MMGTTATGKTTSKEDDSSTARSRRVALAHHWLMSMRGGEKVLAALAERFPSAPIFTLFANVNRLDPALARRDIRTSILQRIPGAAKRYRTTLPLMPAAAGRLDARTYEVVICSDAAVVKGLRCDRSALKICYCHSPMRYVWDLQDEYLHALGPLQRLGLTIAAPALRRWDRRAADSVTAFVANSFHVADRIRRHYERNAIVIPPPVSMSLLTEFEPLEDYYLVLGQQVAYKRSDLAVAACRQLGRRLVVIGEGERLSELRRMAGPTVEFLGWRDDATVHAYMRHCRALLFCGEEDFGIVPVEAQAAGRPVIAYGVGGAVETVVDGQTGVLFEQPAVDSVVNAIRRFEHIESQLRPERCRANAERFADGVFHDRFTRFFAWALDVYDRAGTTAVRAEAERISPGAFLG